MAPRVGRESGGQSRRDEANRISIGVDARTNNLVVAATDPVFEEVKLLVQQLDVAAAEENETVRVVTLHRTSAAAVEKALTAFAGNAVQANNSTTSTSAATGSNTTSSPSSPSSSSSVPPWFSHYGHSYGGSSGGSSGGYPSMGYGWPPGGSSSPYPGYSGRHHSSQSGTPGQ